MTQNANPVDAGDLGSIDTSFPLLAPGNYDLKCIKSSVEPNKANTGEVWNLEFATIDEGKSPIGEIVPAGCRVFHKVGITPTVDATGKPKYTLDAIKKNVARPVQGFGLSKVYFAPPDPEPHIREWAPRVEGSTVRVTLKVTPAGRTADGKDYPAKNEISTFLKRAA